MTREKAYEDAGLEEHKIRVLYVDDEDSNLFAFKASFRRDFEIHTAISGKDGMKIIADEQIDVIISDQRMPEMTGIEFLVEARNLDPVPTRILLTGYADIEAVKDAINVGKVFRYLNKPWEREEMSEIMIAAFQDLIEREGPKWDVDRLKKANKQLEFMVRQSMLS